MFDVFDPAQLPLQESGVGAIRDHVKKVFPCARKLLPEIAPNDLDIVADEFYHLLYNMQLKYPGKYDIAVESQENPVEFWTEFMVLPDSDVFFKPNIKALIMRVLVIPIGSAGVERIISDYNLLKTPIRNRFKVETLDNHLFIRKNGPDLPFLSLQPILKPWNEAHMSSADSRKLQRQTIPPVDTHRSSIWSSLS